MINHLIAFGVFGMVAMSQAGEKVLSIDLISAKKNINVGNWSLSSAQVDMKSPLSWSVRKYNLHGGKQEGVEIVEINNGVLSILIIPTRGMNVLKVVGPDITLGWDSPVKEVVHPKWVDLNYNGGLGWLDSFNEWMVRGGMEYSGHPGDDNGRLMTLHGRVAHCPASEVTVTIEPTNPPTIKVSGLVQERWFKGAQFALNTTLSTVVGSSSFQFDDTITNEASDEKEFQILYHANFAKELLEKDSKLHGTIKSVQAFNDDAAKNLNNFDTYTAPAKVLSGENVFQIIPRSDENGQAHFLLRNAKADKAVSFSYKTDTLPYFSMWKNPDSRENGYVTGLEPGNSFPANRSHERKQGRIQTLKGGESAHYKLKYTLLSGKTAVAKGISSIEKLNQGHEVKLIEDVEHP